MPMKDSSVMQVGTKEKVGPRLLAIQRSIVTCMLGIWISSVNDRDVIKRAILDDTSIGSGRNYDI